MKCASTEVGNLAAPSRGANAGTRPLHWALAVWALIAIALLAMDFARLQNVFPDTDDATRLVQVREFLQNGAWFDTTLPRFGTGGLVSHWSRLVDVPLAALIWLLSRVMPEASAELVVQAIWPLLLLLPALLVLTRTVEDLAGRTAAAFALALTATALTALLQFKPGRIDHHNAMIVTTIVSIFLMARAPSGPRTPLVAGALAAMSLAIGLEALPVVAVSSIALILWALCDERRTPSVTRYALALAVALAVLFAATVAPLLWFDVRCDALSLNLVLLTGIGAAGTMLALGGHRWPIPLRLALLAATGFAGLAAYGALEPACLSGPFGQVPKAIYPVWLDSVGEARPLWWHFPRMPGLVLSIAVMLAAGAMAYALIVRRGSDDRLAYLAAVSIATSLLAVWQFKFLSYATWLAIPGLAILIARVQATASASRLAMQLLAFLCLSPATITAAGVALAKLDVIPAAAGIRASDHAACSAKSAAAALDALPPGLVVSHIDLGPVIVASTRHRALSGPYHRLPDGILAAHRIFASAPADGMAELSRLGARYVVDCPSRTMPGVATAPGSGTLLAALRDGRVPAGLTEVTPPAAAPLRVWRVGP